MKYIVRILLFFVISMSARAEIFNATYTLVKNLSTKSVGSLAADNTTWILSGNGHVADTFNFVSGQTYHVDIEAFGSKANNIYPNMKISVAGSLVKTYVVDKTGISHFSFEYRIQAGGLKEINIAYDNELVTSTEDRNLYLKSITISQISGIARAKLVNVKDFDYKSNGQVDTVDGISWILTENGYVSDMIDVAAGQDYKVQVQAYGTKANNVYPAMSVYVGGQLLNPPYTVGATATNYTPTYTASASGPVEVKITYDNNLQTPTEDRNLYLKTFKFYGPDAAPLLSSAVGTKTGVSTATVGATTNEGNGILYVVVSTSSTLPTIAQIKTGKSSSGSAAAYASNQTITSTGAKTFSVTGLSAGTTYYAHFVHTDNAGNDSNRPGSAGFTTDAASGTVFVNQSFSGFNNSIDQAVRDQLQASGATGVGITTFEAIDMANGHCAITTAPWDAAKKSVVIKYIEYDRSDKFRYYFTSGTLKEVWIRWKEHRSSTFDFGNTKDVAVNSYNTTTVGHPSGAALLTQTYLSVGNTAATGLTDYAWFGVNNQGSGSYPNGNGADILLIPKSTYDWVRGTYVQWKWHLKMNSPGVNDAVVEIYADGVLIGSRTGFRISDSTTQTYLKSVQWGMETTNGKANFAGTSNRSIGDIWVGDYDPGN